MQQDLTGMRLAYYARFSSERQNEKSIEDQVDGLRALAAAAGADADAATTLSDHAVSGTKSERAGYQRLLQMVRDKEVDVILAESISRISRNQSDLHAFYDLVKFHDVRFIGVSDGTDTDLPKELFSIRGIMDEGYLRKLRDETRRGLIGAARAGFSTGGLPYGYRSEPTATRKNRPCNFRVLVDEGTAPVVVWIFEQYRDGRSYGAIASALNARGVLPPRAKPSSERAARGWVASSVRVILGNEKYNGQWRFNACEWRTDPETRKRVRIERPPGEAVEPEREHPHIVSAELWDAVQARRARMREAYRKGPAKGKHRRSRAGKRRSCYPLSGVVVCGKCQRPMTIQAGTSAAYYKCATYKNRGLCDNGRSVKEELIRSAVLGMLRDKLITPASLDYVRKRVAARLGDLHNRGDRELEQRRRELANLESKIGRIIQAIMDGTDSPYMRTEHDRLVAEAKAKKALIDTLEKHAANPIRLPSPDEFVQQVFELEKLMASAPMTARERLRRVFKDGQIVLDPLPDKGYLVRTEILPLVLVGHPSPQDFPGEMVPHGGSGGRI